MTGLCLEAVFGVLVHDFMPQKGYFTMKSSFCLIFHLYKNLFWSNFSTNTYNCFVSNPSYPTILKIRCWKFLIIAWPSSMFCWMKPSCFVRICTVVSFTLFSSSELTCVLRMLLVENSVPGVGGSCKGLQYSWSSPSSSGIKCTLYSVVIIPGKG